MDTKTGVAIREEERVSSPALSPPRISPATIQDTVQSIALLQSMVRDLLLRGIDYGRIPGTPQDSLWDPGASQIISAFNCYLGQRRMIKLEDNEEKIVVVLEVPIISRTTGQEVGSGIGAASTLETKYKYRWVANPQEWGYADIKTFKTKPGKDDEGDETTLYRIPNPEYSELLNTIVKMASKRAEVDAAESLPGVSSVLRQMFSGKKSTKGEYEGPVWQRFWGEVRRLGMTDQEAHAKLGVVSMKDWLAKGRSLDEALNILRGKETEETEAGGFTDSGINIDWLKESIEKLAWKVDGKPVSQWLEDEYHLKGKTVSEILAKMTREQKEAFVKKVQSELNKAAQAKV